MSPGGDITVPTVAIFVSVFYTEGMLVPVLVALPTCATNV